MKPGKAKKPAPRQRRSQPRLFRVAHRHRTGKYLLGDSTEFLNSPDGRRLRGKVDLILTSPPFPLNNKKSYGNLQGDHYRAWFAQLAPLFSNLLAPRGSLVIELGNAWEPNRPVQSLLTIRSLLSLVDHPEAQLRLIQEFVCYNPSRLPSPAQWVTVNRIRTVDSYTHVWWLAKTDRPKADNGRVLRPYSKAMRDLLRRQKYNAGKRPSQHAISETGFLKNHGGSIAHNFLELEPLDKARDVRLPNAFSLANSTSNDCFAKLCREKQIPVHPARMQPGLASFFIDLLTEPGDLVLDPFAGSNTTGYAAAQARRRWVAIESNPDYVRQSRLRFGLLKQSNG
jgi:site-specific DNA-methyltransferase (cytosine-N4-specific)